MFGFLKAKTQEEADFVMIRLHDNKHILRKVNWYCSRPYATTYGDYMSELLPGGELVGQSYEHGWNPASPKMQEFFDSQPKAA